MEPCPSIFISKNKGSRQRQPIATRTPRPLLRDTQIHGCNSRFLEADGLHDIPLALRTAHRQFIMTRWVVVTNQPFNIVEQPAFLGMIAPFYKGAKNMPNKLIMDIGLRLESMP